MGRPFGVTVAAMTVALVAAAECVVAALAGLAVAVGLNGGINFGPRPHPGWMNYGALILGIVLVLMVGWEIGAIAGLLRLREWARRSMVVLGSFHVLLGVGVLVAGFVARMHRLAARSSASPSLSTLHIYPVEYFYLALVGVGAWWVAYFRRPFVRAAFAGGVVN